MKVLLEKEWLGNKPGTTVKVNDLYAKQLIRRGYGKNYDEENINSPSPMIKVQRRDKHKMVESSLNK